MSRVSQAFVLAALVAVAACASKPRIVAEAPPPPAPIVPVYVAPPISPINRGLTQAATVWHLRAALNVAALACRGPLEAGIIQRYNAMLTTHKATFAGAQTALTAEFKAGGGDWQDRQDDAMTRLYNFFSQAQARDAFCTAAAATLAETETLAPGELQAYASAVLPTLDAPFAEMLAPRSVIALASATNAPVYVPVAVAPVAARTVAPAPVQMVAPATVQMVAPAPARVIAPAPAPVVAKAPAAAVATRAPAAAVGTRAPSVAAVQAKPTPRLELDLSGL